MKRMLLALAAIGAAVLGSGFRPAPARTKATLVLTGGRVWTGDPARPWATAIAVSEGMLTLRDDAVRLVVAGITTPDEVRRVIGAKTRSD